MGNNPTNVYTVIATFNGESWIQKCISSLQSSDIKVNIVVVDNKSTDKTCEMVRNQFPDVELIQNSKNLGFGQANNIGIKRVLQKKADYVFLLNQDAWINKNTISDLIRSHKNHPEFGIISPIHLNGEGYLDTKFQMYLTPEFTPELLSDLITRDNKVIYESTFVNAAAWLLPVSTFEKVGGFNSVFYHYGEDDNFIHRCIYHDLRIGVYLNASITHDRKQELIKIHDYSYQRLVNYMRNHILVDLLNPNIDIFEKVRRCVVHFVKGMVRNPFAVIHSLFLVSLKSSSAIKFYRKSKVQYSYKW